MPSNIQTRRALKIIDKTWQRDIKRPRDLQLVYLDTDNRLWPGYQEPRDGAAH